MFRPVAHFSAIAVIATVAMVFGGDRDLLAEPLQKTRPDGSPLAVFNWVLSADPDSLDPQYAYDQQSRRVLEPIYDTLLQYHPLKTERYELMPCMLAEMPKREDGPDGKLSYLCRLKKDIRFHDDACFPDGKGREVIAKDVHYVFQRICDPALNSPFFAVLSDVVSGMTEAHQAAVRNAGKFNYDTMAVGGIELVDRYAFRIHLKRRYPQLEYWMAYQTLSPVAREAVEYYGGQKTPDGDARPHFQKFKPVGTGPFRLAEYVPRQRVRLERVPGYKTTVFPSDAFASDKEQFLRPFAGKALPLVDEVRMTILRDTPTMLKLMREGEVDRLPLSKDAIDIFLTPQRTLSPEFKERGMLLEKDSDSSTFWISFNLEDPIVGKNKKLRQALSCAYNASNYLDTFMAGASQVATQLLPPGVFGYDAKHVNAYGYNLEKAKRLLAEAGYPDGRDSKGKQLVLSLDAATHGGDLRKRAEFDQNMLQKIGVKIVLSENDFPKLFNRKDRGQFQIASGSGWGADYPDAENFYFLFYSKNIPPAGKNDSRYKNPEYDKLFERMSIMEDSPERLAIMQQMRAMIEEDVPVIFAFHKGSYTVTQPWARRIHHNSMLEGGVKYQAIDTKLREKLKAKENGAARRPEGENVKPPPEP